MRLRFLTSTPQNVERGSGTYVGIATLARALERLGVEIELSTPRRHLPVYTLERLLFNERLRFEPSGRADATVGFDMDGYRIAGRGSVPHVAAIKGVIADELRFQKGLTWATMALQERCERLHVRRADLVVTTSGYAAARIRESYGVQAEVIPELIELADWRALLGRNPRPPAPGAFTVLCCCRLYRRKRIDVLLRAAARLRGRIPGLAVRIAGDGPERAEFERVWHAEGLESVVRFLGTVSADQLAAEYNGCDIFCLPSVQEGFGIVFLEAMAAGKPIVAARAAAVPEVAPHGLLAEPDDAGSLADAIERLYADPALRRELALRGSEWVQQFDAAAVARRFLELIQGRLKVTS